MSFLYPSFLWALAAVLVPLIIHLFNFQRYKKVYFSNVKFLKELQMESKSRSRLRELLVLLARCLAIIALAIAFARPYIADQNVAAAAGPPAVAMYLDNSFSMENVGRQGPLLAVARKQAAALVRAYGQDARFYIVTNNFEGAEQRWRTHDDALDFIENVRLSPVSRSLPDVMSRQSSFLSRSERRPSVTYLISDAQRSTFQLTQIRPDTSQSITLLPLLANKVNNLVTDSCWFDSPVRQSGVRQKLLATITNKGSADIETGSARLFINDRQVGLSSFSVQAGATTTVSITYFQESSGFQYGRLKIEDYPITFDDQLFLAYDARMQVNVVAINGVPAEQQNPLSALFGNDSVFAFREFPEQTVDYGAFGSADLIVLNQVADMSSGLVAELLKYTEGGGGLVIIPSAEPAPSYQPAFTALGLPAFGPKDTTPVTTADIDHASGFFAGVFEKKQERMNLPLVRTHFTTRTGALADRLLRLSNGDELLFSQKKGSATIFVFTSPLFGEHSNFSRHALFVPALYRIAMLSMAQQPPYYYLHPDIMITIRDRAGENDQPPHIVSRDSAIDIIPERRTANNATMLFPRSQLASPGYYTLTHQEKPLLPLAFNYTRVESDLSAYTAAELREIVSEKGWKKLKVIEDTGETIQSQVQLATGNSQLWKLFIILALVFFLAECLLLRFLR